MDEKKVLRVLHGYLELNAEEKMLFIEEVKKSMNNRNYDKMILERINKTFSYNLGPTNSTNCPCCGKG